jgi:2-desacetyl-2-hydroxyethyl bacteriochlorophyllide A dehydrogenase
MTYPIDGWGYEEVGQIVSAGDGVDPDCIGNIVWGLWGHRSDAVMPAEQAAAQRLPDSVDPRAGIFARVGAVALNAVIDGDLHVGETVVIFGQGVIGLLATRLAALSGARVIAVDAQPQRLEMSRHFGAEHVALVGRDAPAELVRELTGGRGADVCIEMSGAYPALHEAVRTVGYAGRVVASGFYQGGAGALRLGEEFHHNRVEIIASQISGAPTRYGNRWNKTRLHAEVMRLISEGKLDPLPLISHVLPAASVADAFALVMQANPDVLQVVLDFRE